MDNNRIGTVVEVHGPPDDITQPEEERQLDAVPAKEAGRKNAEQINKLERRLVTQKVTFSGGIGHVHRSISNLKKDLNAEYNPAGSLIQSHKNDNVRLKGNDVKDHHSAAATLFNITKAVAVFREARGTSAFHQDAE